MSKALEILVLSLKFLWHSKGIEAITDMFYRILSIYLD